MGFLMKNNKLFVSGLTALTITLAACGGGKTSMFRGDPVHSGLMLE